MRLILFTITLFSLTNGLQAIEKKASPARQIDELVEKQLQAKGLTFNEPITDAVFVRRIYLDIIGRIPTKTETETFLNSGEKNKRSLLIDQLLKSDGYVSNFYHLWADMLRARTEINGNNQGSATGRAYEQWIKTALRENKPYDVMVRELLTATGHSWENGAVGYYIRDYGMPLDNTAMTAQVFLGTQIVCAQCHNHPFDKWTQMDYYHIAAFSYGMTSTNTLPQGNKELQIAINRFPEKLDDQTQKDLKRAFSEILKPVRFNNVIATSKLPQLPHDYQYKDAKPKSTVTPASIMGPKAVLSPSQPTIESFADWVTSRDNPRFSLVMANRLWKKAFGLGLIEPIDDLKDHTSASNPELMKYLEGLLKQKNYDMKAYLAAIFKSKTYQRAASLQEIPIGMPYDFPGPVLRRMSAEQVWDSVVSMVRENPDLPDEGWNLAAKEQILRRQLIGESLYNQDSNEFVRNGLEVLKVQKELSEKIDAAVAKLTEARETNDLEKISEASDEVKEARRALSDEIERRVYLGGLKDGIEVAANTKSDSPASDAFFNELVTTMKERGNGNQMAGMEAIVDDEGGIVAKLVRAMLADENAALAEKQLEQSSQEMKAWNTEKKNSKKAFTSFKTVSARMVRASELPSPAPLGHFLREFGQSDRELIDNSNDQASVTQALTLLNGTVPAAVANPFSVFSRNMKEGANFNERLDNVYLTMFSRPATTEETAIFAEAWKADPESATVSGIAWTLLNTRQFLFIN
jgi:Protein of unknown function (DUF1549)/Protein of unknown function (DUF1553)